MVKYCLLYYSRGGRTRLAAQYISRGFSKISSIDMEEIVCKMSFWRALWISISGRRVEAYGPKNLSEYSHIILCFPIWIGKPAAPVYSYLNKVDISGKKFFLFASCRIGCGGAIRHLASFLKSKGAITLGSACFPRILPYSRWDKLFLYRLGYGLAKKWT